MVHDSTSPGFDRIWDRDGSGVVVHVSTSPGFDRNWDRDGSGPSFDPVQDSTFVTNVVSVSNTSSIDIILLSPTSLIKID